MNKEILSPKALGQLNEIARLAHQDIADWKGYEALDQYGLEAYRYQIAFMAYTIALAQYYFLPAYRSSLREVYRKLIDRLLSKPAWQFWEEVSRGSPQYDPDWEGQAESVRDPIREKNVMYSGHVAHMLALYEMLYNDYSWENPGSIRLEWDASEVYSYNLKEVVEVLYKQMQFGPTGGIECEPNAVFPECNQHPVLAFLVYDALHGASYGEARHRFKKLFESAPMIDPKSHEVIFYYRAKQGTIVSRKHPDYAVAPTRSAKLKLCCGIASYDSSAACGWTGALMNAWDPGTVTRHYEFQKHNHFSCKGSSVVPKKEMLFGEMGVGLFATLAAEVGDTDFCSDLLDYADAHYKPEWKGKDFCYPSLRAGEEGLISNLGEKFLAMARVNKADGLRDLHIKPWQEGDYSHPLLEGVAAANAQVAAAHWRSSDRSLETVLVANNGSEETAELSFSGFDSSKAVRVMVDDERFAEIGQGARESSEKASFTDATTLRVRVPVSKTTSVRVENR